ncbi:hypothetical protein B0T25DRAFT_308756 [Lasiosphaeria hispida]|uniref:Uncharacterized protein n=1 Tax=Lasiosphaeria hispida TaxID=260671 RepID=A0AAJ0H8M2_9PEZI|nr:hypothetical protein B0T25DRAFT_308756 [Lasiosphaeria hispida]
MRARKTRTRARSGDAESAEPASAPASCLGHQSDVSLRALGRRQLCRGCSLPRTAAGPSLLPRCGMARHGMSARVPSISLFWAISLCCSPKAGSQSRLHIAVDLVPPSHRRTGTCCNGPRCIRMWCNNGRLASEGDTKLIQTRKPHVLDIDVVTSCQCPDI